MKQLKKQIDQREQVLATGLLRPGSANNLVGKITRGNVAQLELEHLRILLWSRFLEDIVDDDVDVRSLLGKGEKGIYDEANRILLGEAGWDYNPSSD